MIDVTARATLDKWQERSSVKGKILDILRIKPELGYTVKDVFDEMPPGVIYMDANGRKREIQIPLVSHNGKHRISKNIMNDPIEMYYDDMLVSKVIIREFEWKIFLAKRKAA